MLDAILLIFLQGINTHKSIPAAGRDLIICKACSACRALVTWIKTRKGPMVANYSSFSDVLGFPPNKYVPEYDDDKFGLMLMDMTDMDALLAPRTPDGAPVQRLTTGLGGVGADGFSLPEPEPEVDPEILVMEEQGDAAPGPSTGPRPVVVDQSPSGKVVKRAGGQIIVDRSASTATAAKALFDAERVMGDEGYLEAVAATMQDILGQKQEVVNGIRALKGSGKLVFDLLAGFCGEPGTKDLRDLDKYLSPILTDALG